MKLLIPALLLGLVVASGCEKPAASAPTPAGAAPASAPASATPAPNSTPASTAGSDIPNKSAESKSPPSTGPGNTTQVQESSAHGATQTTEEKKK
jgi:hypothetical protein